MTNASSKITSKPLHTRVIVQLLPVGSEETTTASGLIVVQQTKDGSPVNPIRLATVIAVGDGEYMYDGKLRPLLVKAGDTVRCHENDVLPLDSIVDYTQPYVGIVDERQILTVEVSG